MQLQFVNIIAVYRCMSSFVDSTDYEKRTSYLLVVPVLIKALSQGLLLSLCISVRQLLHFS